MSEIFLSISIKKKAVRVFFNIPSYFLRLIWDFFKKSRLGSSIKVKRECPENAMSADPKYVNEV